MFAKKVSAALDLGDYSLKYVEVETDTGVVRKAWQRELQPDRQSAKDSLVGERLRTRLAALASALQSELSPPPGVVTAMQGDGTWVQYLEFPPLSASELKVAAHAAACKAIPFSLDRVVLTTVQVPPIQEGRSAVLVVAALREPATQLSELFDACGFAIHRMEVVPLALAREFSRNHPERAKSFVGLVNVGFSLTHVLVVRNGLPYYVREFPIGARHFMHGLQVATRIPWREAQSRFVEYDATAREPAYEPAVRAWLHDVNRSVSHFNEKLGRNVHSVKEVWLSGGCAALKGLRERAAADLGITVVNDGWERIRWVARPSEAEAGAWKAAVGMALEP